MPFPVSVASRLCAPFIPGSLSLGDEAEADPAVVDGDLRGDRVAAVLRPGAPVRVAAGGGEREPAGARRASYIRRLSRARDSGEGPGPGAPRRSCLLPQALGPPLAESAIDREIGDAQALAALPEFEARVDSRPVPGGLEPPVRLRD